MVTNASNRLAPQLERVLIALTKDFPRTAQGIAIDLGIPEPSVRRAISQLKTFGFSIRSRQMGTYKRFTLNPRVF